MEFEKIPMLKSLKKFIIFFKKINKEGSILKIFAGFNSKPNRVSLSETFGNLDTPV
jgi:hypothetical protein